MNKYKFIKDCIDRLGYDEYEYKYSATNIFGFSNNERSIIVIDESFYLNIQYKLEKKIKPKKLGGYKFYEINQIIDNPWFNNNDRYLESIFIFDDIDYKNYFNKIKQFINKVLQISSELEHFPEIHYDSNREVRIKTYTHDTKNVTDKDVELTKKITNIYNLLS